MIDKNRIEKAIKEIIIALGDDPDRPGLVDTPKRVAKMYEEVFEGMNYTNAEIADKFCKCFDTDNNDLVVNVNNIFDGAKVRVHIIGDNLEIETYSKIYEEIADILEDLEIETVLKMKIDKAIFNDLPIKKKRILLRKLKRDKLEPKYINMFIGLLEFMEEKK